MLATSSQAAVTRRDSPLPSRADDQDERRSASASAPTSASPSAARPTTNSPPAGTPPARASGWWPARPGCARRRRPRPSRRRRSSRPSGARARRTPWPPNAAAERTTAPRLRGSVTPSSATISGVLALLVGARDQVVGVRVLVRRDLQREALVDGPVGHPVELGARRLQQRDAAVGGDLQRLAHPVVGVDAARPRSSARARARPRAAPRRRSCGRRPSRARRPGLARRARGARARGACRASPPRRAWRPTLPCGPSGAPGARSAFGVGPLPSRPRRRWPPEPMVAPFLLPALRIAPCAGCCRPSAGASPPRATSAAPSGVSSIAIPAAASWSRIASAAAKSLSLARGGLRCVERGPHQRVDGVAQAGVAGAAAAEAHGSASGSTPRTPSMARTDAAAPRAVAGRRRPGRCCPRGPRRAATASAAGTAEVVVHGLGEVGAGDRGLERPGGLRGPLHEALDPLEGGRRLAQRLLGVLHGASGSAAPTR